MTEPADALPTGRFDGREAFRQLVRDALQHAEREGWAELLLCDANFHDWPLGEQAVVQTLDQWARSGRRLTLLAGEFDTIVRQHSRFRQWRVRWDHIVTCRKAAAAYAQDVPSAIWSPHWVLERRDPLRCIGVAGAEPERRVLLRESLDEWLERKSSSSFPASTLGL